MLAKFPSMRLQVVLQAVLQEVFGDKAPLRLRDRRDRKPIASGEHLHVGKLCMIAQRGEWNERRLLHEVDVDEQPARLFRR